MNQNPWLGWLIIILLIWTLPWKALALWRSARRGDRAWFIIFVIVNTVGILEIIYLLTFGKEKVELAVTESPELPSVVQPEETFRKII